MKAANTTPHTKQAKTVTARVLLGVFVATLLLLPAAPATRGHAAQSEESFAHFWTRFKAALAKGDQQAVASMTRFRTGDATYMTNKEFLAKWYGELRRERRRCFARAKPVRDQESYSVFCGERIFLFERVEGAWKFTEIGVDD